MDNRELLDRADAEHSARRFTGAPITQFGYGDEQTWGPCNDDPMDPRTEEVDDQGAIDYLSTRYQIQRLHSLLSDALYALATDRPRDYRDRISLALMRLQELVEETEEANTTEAA